MLQTFQIKHYYDFTKYNNIDELSPRTANLIYYIIEHYDEPIKSEHFLEQQKIVLLQITPIPYSENWVNLAIRLEFLKIFPKQNTKI